MSKIVYIMDSRVSNTPEKISDGLIDEVNRRICTLSEDYCIISTDKISLDRADMLRRVMIASEADIRQTNEQFLVKK